MREQMIKELSASNSFLAKFLEELLESRKIVAEEKDECLRIPTKGMSAEIQMALARSGYLLKKTVDDTKVSIRTDMEYIYFWLN